MPIAAAEGTSAEPAGGEQQSNTTGGCGNGAGGQAPGGRQGGRKAVERVLTMEYPPAPGQQSSVPEALVAAAAATEWR